MSAELRRRIEARRRIYLLRHGEVSYFDGAGKPWPPHSVPLNAEGRAQAEAAAAALLSIPLDRAVHSGLPRAQGTAEIILRSRGIAAEACPALREITPGSLAGEAQSPASSLQSPPLLDPAARRQARPPDLEAHLTGAFRGPLTRDSRFLGGESFGDFEDRVLPAFHQLIAANGWKHLLVVAHGGVNRVILRHALTGGIETLARLEQEAGCINVIDVHEDLSLLVRQVNFTPSSPVKENVWATTMERIYLEYRERAGLDDPVGQAPPAGAPEEAARLAAGGGLERR